MIKFVKKNAFAKKKNKFITYFLLVEVNLLKKEFPWINKFRLILAIKVINTIII